jgi:glycosyltransferase involved in cell wall biosynthesis
LVGLGDNLRAFQFGRRLTVGGYEQECRMSVASNLSASIALATFNGERYLSAQLDSLIAQRISPNEIIVADDCSTDRTVEIIQAYQKQTSIPIRLHINEKRLGYRANFMKAADKCSCDIIFFCDQDDVWSPSKLERVLQCFEDPNTLLAYHNAALVDAEGHRYGTLVRRPPAEHFTGLDVSPWHFSPGFTQAFRSGLRRFDDEWALNRYFMADGFTAHDRWYMFLALGLGRVAFIDQELACYRQHATNAHGVAQRPKLPERLSRYVRAIRSVDPEEAVIAKNRAKLLRRISKSSHVFVSGLERLHSNAVAERYEHLAERLHRRNATLSNSSIASRFGAWTKALSCNDYSQSDKWRFNASAIADDLFVGVIKGR